MAAVTPRRRAEAEAAERPPRRRRRPAPAAPRPGRATTRRRSRAATMAVKPSSDDYSDDPDRARDGEGRRHGLPLPRQLRHHPASSASTSRTSPSAAPAPRSSDVVLDFKKQTMGDDGWSRHEQRLRRREHRRSRTRLGNGLVVTGVKGVTYKDMKVFWDAGSVSANGSYAVYPVSSENVLIDGVEVVGAADAGDLRRAVHPLDRPELEGARLGRRRSRARTTPTARSTTTSRTTTPPGILVFALPDKMKKDALDTNVHDNDVHDNNRAELRAGRARRSSNVPVGIGILILAADYAEIHKNTVTNQDTVGLTMVSLKTFALHRRVERRSRRPTRTPSTITSTTTPSRTAATNPVSPLERPARRGRSRTSSGTATSATPGSAHLCLGTSNLPTFRDVNGIANIGDAGESVDGHHAVPVRRQGAQARQVLRRRAKRRRIRARRARSSAGAADARETTTGGGHGRRRRRSRRRADGLRRTSDSVGLRAVP